MLATNANVISLRCKFLSYHLSAEPDALLCHWHWNVLGYQPQIHAGIWLAGDGKPIKSVLMCFKEGLFADAIPATQSTVVHACASSYHFHRLEPGSGSFQEGTGYASSRDWPDLQQTTLLPGPVLLAFVCIENPAFASSHLIAVWAPDDERMRSCRDRRWLSQWLLKALNLWAHLPCLHIIIPSTVAVCQSGIKAPTAN